MYNSGSEGNIPASALIQFCSSIGKSMVQLAKSTDGWGSQRELRCSGAPLVRHLNHQYLPCSGSSCLVESTTRLWSFKREHLLQLPPVFWKLWWIWYSCTRIGRLKLVPPPLQHRVLAVPLQRKGQAQLWHPSHGDSGEISSSPMDVPHYYKEKKPYLKKITNIQSPQDSGSLLR